MRSPRECLLEQLFDDDERLRDLNEDTSDHATAAEHQLRGAMLVKLLFVESLAAGEHPGQERTGENLPPSQSW